MSWSMASTRPRTAIDRFACDLQASVASYERQWQTHPGLVKIQEDLDRYDVVIDRTRPEVLVECGTWRGHSAGWFSERVPRVVTVDVEDHVDSHLHGYLGITWLRGSSTDPMVAERVRTLAAGARTMVVLDSDHSPEHVRRELELYAPLVSLGCYLVVEDGICRYVPETPVTEAGPLDALEEFLPRSGWERDLEVEGLYPATHHLAGWLRRV